MEIADDGSVALDLPFTYLPIVQLNFPKALVVQGDGTMLPFRDSSFDWVLCSEVLEHVPNRDDMINEFSRVLKCDGILVLTTPNWINWFGFFRIIFEKILQKPIHAGDQPIDKWTTYRAIKREFAPYFEIIKMRGWWYFPPIGRGRFQILPGFFAFLWRILMPFERFCQKVLPWFGHSICVAAKPKK